MKKMILSALLLAAAVAQAQNAKQPFAGSDTLAGVMTDAIIQAGLEGNLAYVGGGSGTGEKNLVAGDQGIAPMSREMKAEALQTLKSQGSAVTAHVIGLDGLAVLVNNQNGLQALDVPTVAKIFTCEITRWEQLPASGLKGEIKAYRRDDKSGTTDAFKHFTGVKTFGACVTVSAETTEISDKTSRDPLAVGYAGLSGKANGNHTLALAAQPGQPAVAGTTATIRNGSYPFARKLYVYEVTGARKATDAEAALLTYVTDRSFMDPIMQAHEFITLD